MIVRLLMLLVMATCSGCFTVSLDRVGPGSDINATLVGVASSLPQPGGTECELQGEFVYQDLDGTVDVDGSFGCPDGNPQANTEMTIFGIQSTLLSGGCDGVEPTLFGFRGFNCWFESLGTSRTWTGSVEYVGLPF